MGGMYEAMSSGPGLMVCLTCSTCPLMAGNPQDHFYICPAHLKDRAFCSPIVDAEQDAAKKKKEELDREIEKVKKEYEEKKRRREEKGKAKSKNDKDKDKDKKDESKADKDEDDADATKAEK